jgi:putative membrane-bound dehydrogenase-like protein
MIGASAMTTFVLALLAVQEPPPFEYVDAEVPFYAGSHKLGQPQRRMQKPLPAESSAKRLRLSDGFEARLFAADPQIAKPIAMAFDARGRLWIAESMDYPNELGKNRDRIRICEDSDGDGRADRFTTFAEGLSIPTSLCFAAGGVVVAQAPDQLLLRDTDGDGRADERKVLFSGWGTGDTHAGPSNQRIGFDGWIWGIVGYSGFNGQVGGRLHRFGMGFYRFRPDGSELEFIRSTNNNSWGLGWSEDGLLFGSTANGNPSEFMPIANRHYESVSGMAAPRLGGIAEGNRFFPATDRIRQVDHHGGFTAAAGHALYTARLFPREWWNRRAFVCEPTGHLVAIFDLEAKGSAFGSRCSSSFLASDDEWTAPIAAEVGPDGAVWVIDWYNYIIQHNPTPAGFKNGKGNAYETPLRDKVHGRIYRVLPKGASVPASLDLERAPNADLVKALANDNLLWRLHAQRLLVERKAQDAVPSLRALLDGPAPAALHAVWALRGLGAPADPLAHPSPAVRRAAVLGLPPAAKILEGKLLEDPDAQVRLAALLALSELPADDAAGAAVFAMLRKPENAHDKWIPDAATAAAARHDGGFLRAALGNLKADVAGRATPENLLRNDWKKSTYAGQADFTKDEPGREGGAGALRIASKDGADAGWLATAEVKAGGRYRLAGWIRAKGLDPASGLGALFNVHELQGIKTPHVAGNGGWRLVETEFTAERAGRISINALFGGWGRSKGEAWYEGVTLTEVGGGALGGRLGGVVTAVTRHFARRGPVDSVGSVLEALRTADAGLAAFMIEGLAEGWPAGKSPALSASESASLASLAETLPPAEQERLLHLAERWGKRELLGAKAAAIVTSTASRLADPKRPAEERIAAARALLKLADGAESVSKVLAPIAPQSAPGLVLGLLDAAAESRAPEAGTLMLARWSDLTPAARRRAASHLLRQAAWTAALLDAIEKGPLTKGDLAADHWTQLRNHPEAALAARAAKLESTGPGAVSPDREALLQKLLPLAERAGDAKRGGELFAQLCAKCHAMAGQAQQGRVGPELTGVGARARRDVLSEIVDPNRSVEANFRMWQVKTTDGSILAGRLDTETATTVELLDTEGKSHVVQRSSIELMKGSALSIMPVGLVDALPESDLAALLEYLAASREGPAKRK